MDNILITSGFNIEGYRITKYLGIYTGEAALGTGFLSSLGAGFADILGSNSSMYSNKLQNAKNIAMKVMLDNASRAGADGIIGVDIDYASFSADIMGAIVSGTAVKLEKIMSTASKKIEQEITVIPVGNYGTEIPYRPYQAEINSSDKTLRVHGFSYKKDSLSAVQLNICANTIFDEIVDLGNYNFIDFNHDGRLCTTEYLSYYFDDDIIRCTKSLKIKILRCVLDNMAVVAQEPVYNIMTLPDELDKLQKLYGKDVVCDYSLSDTGWICLCGKENPLDSSNCLLCGRVKNSYETQDSPDDKNSNFIRKIETLENAREMFEYISNCIKEQNENFSQELLDIVNKYVTLEKFYGGSQKKACLEKVRDYFGEHN
ncbi:YbjQ family protein [Ruminococcus sp. OA3]|uniref:YbjQ family protein n=1 Tax=Ruminococcus sp. OA3 TaxID=2914164 RepID=UPI001F061F55|nr:YbjQ family protein [Ruminococcus sp. OA3]MCH1982712.1 YbjQ family protein [Ruminococcus sp. OA3]